MAKKRTTKDFLKELYYGLNLTILELINPAFIHTKNPKEEYAWTEILTDWETEKHRIREIIEVIAKEDTLEDDKTYWQFEGGFDAYKKQDENSKRIIIEILPTMLNIYLKYAKELNYTHTEFSEESKQFSKELKAIHTQGIKNGTIKTIKL